MSYGFTGLSHRILNEQVFIASKGRLLSVPEQDGAVADLVERAKPPILASGALKNAEATTTAASTLKSAEALWLPEMVWAVDPCI